jgi:hypothetical protein
MTSKIVGGLGALTARRDAARLADMLQVPRITTATRP